MDGRPHSATRRRVRSFSWRASRKIGIDFDYIGVADSRGKDGRKINTKNIGSKPKQPDAAPSPAAPIVDTPADPTWVNPDPGEPSRQELIAKPTRAPATPMQKPTGEATEAENRASWFRACWAITELVEGHRKHNLPVDFADEVAARIIEVGELLYQIGESIHPTLNKPPTSHV